MATNKRSRQRARQVSKKKQEKKHLIDPRYNNLFWTVVVIIVLLIFFIINNTRYVPEHGSYPPNFDAAKHKEEVHTQLNKELYGLDSTSSVKDSDTRYKQ